jgi:hypothetical protein
MTLRTLVEGFPHDWQIEIVKRTNLTPVYWVSNDLNNRHLLPPDVIYHRGEDAMLGVPPPEMRISAPDSMPNEYFEEHVRLVDTVLRMLAIREDQFGEAFPSYSQRRRHVYDLVAYWSHVLDQFSIEAVLIEAIPHLPHHYVIYHLAKERGLLTMFFNRVGEPSRFFICDDLANAAPVVAGAGASGKAEELVPSRTPPKYAVYRTPGKGGINKLKGRFSFSASFVQEMFNYARARFRVETDRRWQQRSKRRFRRDYDRLAITSVPSTPFVYYALSEQPEDTSFPLGGNFEDQIYGARYLASMLPDGMKLIIKEHPNQRPWRGRHSGYYTELAAIPGVELIAMNISTFDLIEKCDAVATISGQAGWEGLTHNKPAITFGTAWYSSSPYVYSIESLKRDPHTIWAARPLDPAKISDWFVDFLASTHEGYMNTISAPSSPLSIEENIQAVSSAINDHIQRINSRVISTSPTL